MPDPHAPETDKLAQRFAQRLDELRARLATANPARLAHNTGAQIERLDQAAGTLSLSLWGRVAQIAFPGYAARWAASGAPISPFEQAMLLYYLDTADGAPLAGSWISFSDLPDGRFYVQAFNGYTGQELAQHFGDDRFAFETACQALHGTPHPLGDAAYAFQALPNVPLLAVYWQGDEDFPAACQVLFDAAASHYLPTDAYAILGSTLTRMLIKASAS